MSASFKFHRGRLIRLPVRIKHKFPSRPVMALDTGSSLMMITPRIAREIGLDLTSAKSKMPLVGVAGSAWAVEVTLARVSIMGMAVENVKALCHPLPPELGLDGIIGLNFLQHFNLAIAHDTETVTVERCLIPAYII
jgi:clan AA aspartic protease (TIGR02281 family)